MVKMLAAVADFERDLIIERTQAGQARARAAGTHMGRPSKTTPDQQRAIRAALAAGGDGQQHGGELPGEQGDHHCYSRSIGWMTLRARGSRIYSSAICSDFD